MGAPGAMPVQATSPAPTPKSLINQKFGSGAVYKIEQIQQNVESSCPGLAVPQQIKMMYRCTLEVPELTVTSDVFQKKKDAEQAAAKIVVEKLGIQPIPKSSTPEEALNEIAARVSGFFTDELKGHNYAHLILERVKNKNVDLIKSQGRAANIFVKPLWFDIFLHYDVNLFLSSIHPLLGHLRLSMRRGDALSGMIPLSAIAACDTKVNSLCKTINPESVNDPLLVLKIILRASKMSDSICTRDGELWVWKKDPFSPEPLQSIMQSDSDITSFISIEAIHLPCSIEDQIEALTLDVSSERYYLDEIAEKLGARDSSQIVASKSIGKASSEMKLYFSVPGVPSLYTDSSLDLHANMEENGNLLPKQNLRASYLSGQTIYGDAILANVGYKWSSVDLYHEAVPLSTYYRMLLAKVPDGHYKLSREAILAVELPLAFTSRSNWRGPSPWDLLCVFCRQHRLSEPEFSVKSYKSPEASSELLETFKKPKLQKITKPVVMANGGLDAGDLVNNNILCCELKISSSKQDPLIECSVNNSFKRESDAKQSIALKVLVWFNKYFKQLDMPVEKLCSFGYSHNVMVYAHSLAQQFSRCFSFYGVKQSHYPRCNPVGFVCTDQPNGQENGVVLFNIEGPESSALPSSGTLVCISYTVFLAVNGDPSKEALESNDEFEFEVGTGAVISQLESCVIQLSVNQSAQFIVELPSSDLILAAALESSKCLSKLSIRNCYLEYSVKVLRVTEPPEERMEQAFFNPPLSKQRVEFAVEHINKSRSTTLVDFGCGSGSLLDSLLGHNTTLEKIVGVDISRKGLARAAKILHSKLSTDPEVQSCVKSAILYDGSITDFDNRLQGFDIGTCLEVIEHMEEDQAGMFGDIALGFFCPRVLVISTPNYEYNTILKKAFSCNKDDEPEDKSAPCKFRNHDHKFEWTRQQFEHWAANLSARHNYSVEFSGVGGRADEEPGFASQIAVFRAPNQEDLKCSRMAEPVQPYEVIWEWPTKSRSA